MKRIFRSKKGFTLAEVLIAIVLITIVSASATTVISQANRIKVEVSSQMELENDIQAALECFRYADDEEEFFVAMQKYGEYKLERISYETGIKKTVSCTKENKTYYIVLAAVFYEGAETRDMLTVRIFETGDYYPFYFYEYSKGVDL